MVIFRAAAVGLAFGVPVAVTVGDVVRAVPVAVTVGEAVRARAVGVVSEAGQPPGGAGMMSP